MKIGDKLLLEILDLGMDGEGIARQDGMTVFVPLAVTGDLVSARVVHIRRELCFAELLRVVRPSALRCTPPCPYFGDCGGCDIQHILPAAQADFKRTRVMTCLRKNGLADIPVDQTVCGNPWQYRNKLQLPFGTSNGRVVLGFYKKASHDVVPMTECMLHGEWATTLIATVSQWANKYSVSAYDETTRRGLLRHLVARYVDGHLAVTIVIAGNILPHAQKLFDLLCGDFDCTLYQNENCMNTNVIFGARTKQLFGEDKIYTICGIRQTLSPLSFLQVNDEIRDLMYAHALHELVDTDIVFDVFSGAGAMSALLARNIRSSYYPCVYGIEIVPEATRDADNLMRLNELSTRVCNVCEDATTALPRLTAELDALYPRFTTDPTDTPQSLDTTSNESSLANSLSRTAAQGNASLDTIDLSTSDRGTDTTDMPRTLDMTSNESSLANSLSRTAAQGNASLGAIDLSTSDRGTDTTEIPKTSDPYPINEASHPRTTVLLDPPRKGCPTAVLDAVISVGATRVVYISCNPATLARDLSHLSIAYTITSVTPYDMFPQTKHVETLVCLARK